MSFPMMTSIALARKPIWTHVHTLCLKTVILMKVLESSVNDPFADRTVGPMGSHQRKLKTLPLNNKPGHLGCQHTFQANEGNIAYYPGQALPFSTDGSPFDFH